MEYKYQPKTKEELKRLCVDDSIYLGDIDTSLITDMSRLFYNGFFEESYRKDFSGIEKWDVSNVTDMSSMFCGAKKFNQNIGIWNTSKVENMACMFCRAEKFNQPIRDWDVSNVKDMRGMFCGAKNFNQPIGDWTVDNVKDMSGIFYLSLIHI